MVPSPVMGVAAVVLAAGEGTRFGGPGHKLLAELPGRPGVSVIDAAVAAVVESRRRLAVDEIFVVWGAVALHDRPWSHEVTLVHHDGWAAGQASSLLAGIGAADRGGHDVVVACPGDQPGVGPDAWCAVATSASAVGVASFATGLRPPVRLERSVWGLLPRWGDEGARAVMRSHPDLVVAVPVTGDPTDIDTLEDLERWT